MQDCLLDLAKRVPNQPIKSLWGTGLGTNMSSVAVSSGVRLGCYPLIRDVMLGGEEKTPMVMWLAGFVSGSMGFLLASPLFQSKVLLQRYTPMHRNGLDVLKDLHSRGRLYNGASVLMVRGAFLSAGAALGYDFSKTKAKQMGIEEGFGVHLVSSVLAAFMACTMSAPLDV